MRKPRQVFRYSTPTGGELVSIWRNDRAFSVTAEGLADIEVTVPSRGQVGASLSLGRAAATGAGLVSAVSGEAGTADIPFPPDLAATPDSAELSNGLLEEIIAEARERLLALGAGFDGRAAPSIDVNTVDRAAKVLRTMAERLAREGASMRVPDIMPGPDGSVKLEWDESDFELLMTIHADPARPPSFYGDDFADVQVKGSLKDPHNPNRLVLAWLRKLG